MANNFTALNNLAKMKNNKINDTVNSVFTGQNKINVQISDIKAAKEDFIKINNIKEREVNDFAEVNLATLKESVKNLGLIHPIAVSIALEDKDLVGTVNGDLKKIKFQIISGHRRFRAIKELHEEYPNEKRFTEVNAKIYYITNEENIDISKGYISKEMEEAMYRDANFESRQLVETDVIKHVEYLYEKIKNNDELREKYLAKQNENNTRKVTKLDYSTVLPEILNKELKIKISSKSVKRVLRLIKDNNTEAVERIKNGEAIRKVYDQVYLNEDDKTEEEDNKVIRKVTLARFEKLTSELEERVKGNVTDKLSKKDIDNINKIKEEIVNIQTEIINVENAWNRKYNKK